MQPRMTAKTIDDTLPVLDKAAVAMVFSVKTP
jgi:hypothetical protein